MKSPKKLLLSVLLVMLSIATIACFGNTLQDIADELNADEELHAGLDGLYTIHAIAQGDSTIIVSFQAVLEELATLEVAQAVAEGAALEFQEAVQEMEKAGVPAPEVVLEFLDMDGNMIYIRKFT